MKRYTMYLFKLLPSIVLQEINLQQTSCHTVYTALILAMSFSNPTVLGQTRSIFMHSVSVLLVYVLLVGPVFLLQCQSPVRRWEMANSSGGSMAMSQIFTLIQILEDHKGSVGVLGTTQTMSLSGKTGLVRSWRSSLEPARTWLPLMLTDTLRHRSGFPTTAN